MLRSEVEHFIELWESGDCKVFRYIRPLVPNEYVVIRKASQGNCVYLYEPDDQKSTYCLPPMEEDKMVKAMANEELVYVKPWNWQVSTRDMKTGGCVCGAWAVRESERIHTRGCPLGRGML